MKKIPLIIIVFILSSCGSDEPNPCLMAKDFIVKELNYPQEADISIFNCNKENNPNGSYTVLQKVSASNAFGVKKEYIFKLNVLHNGGVPTDINNWSLIKIESEEYKR